jgi:hypothetical protein
MNVEEGNPYLKPMKESYINLSYNYTKGDLNWEVGTKIKIFEDIHLPIISIDANNIRHSKYENSGRAIVYGVFSAISLSIFNKLSLNPGIYIYYIDGFRNSNQKDLVSCDLSLNVELAINKLINIGCDFEYQSRTKTIQGYEENKPNANIYSVFSLFKERGNLRIGIVPIKWERLTVEDTNEFYCKNNKEINQQTVYLEFSYTLFKGIVLKEMRKSIQMEKDF